MAPSSNDSLGQVVRGLRERQGWTQEQLGREAGYRTGAGVSISRLEGGLLRPTPERLAGIALSLGVTVEELEARAAAGGQAAPTSRRAPAPPVQKDLNARRQQVEREAGERTRVITELGDAFNEAHDRARAEFFDRLVAVGGRVEGAPQLDPTRLGDDDPPEPEVASTSRGESGDAIGGRVHGRARSATRSTLVLAGIVAVPVGMLLAGGLAYMVKRNRRQRLEFDAQLDAAEAQLAATRPGVSALQDLLPRAAATLDYIATHGGHAVARWEGQVAPGSTTWDALSRTEQRRYRDFVEVAEAQISIATVDFQGLLTASGGEQTRLLHHADEVLSRSRDAVTAHV